MLRRLAPAALLIVTLLAPRVSSEETNKAAPVAATSMELLRGWEIQSSCDAKATGDQVSKAGFSTTGWHRTTVPNTVVGTLVDDKTYRDSTYGTNMKDLPGMNYSAATFFANQDMPEGSPFRCSWWWRNEFVVPPAFAKKNISI